MKAADSSSTDPNVGKILGGVYEIRARIGEGGMGSVYEVNHTHLDKLFAVKVLHPARVRSPKALQRFIVEAKAASQIDHDNIVRVVNFVTEGDEVFIVMERLQGEDLAQRIARGPLPVEDAIRIASRVASALQAAHDQGILHRDLKPQNIFLDQRRGHELVKVLDFGISKFVDDEVQLTATDQMVGTPLYVSPEVARGDGEIDHRADVYALAAITYEMVTGVPPFSGDNQYQLIWKHSTEAPPAPSSRGVQIPRALEQAIVRGLEKDPSARFDSMDAFAHALEQDTGGAGRPAPVVKTRRRAALALALTLAAAVATAFFWPEVRRALSPAQPQGRMTAVPGQDEKPARPPWAETTPRLVDVRINSEPAGATVSVDGEIVGETPVTVPLARGQQNTVRFSLTGYARVERQFVAEPGVPLEQSLTKLPARRPKSPIKQEF